MRILDTVDICSGHSRGLVENAQLSVSLDVVYSLL